MNIDCFFLSYSVRALCVVLSHSFALNKTIMDRITLFDIEINTLFEFAYNLFFVYSVSFSKRLMNKAPTDDIQLWRKSNEKTFPSMLFGAIKARWDFTTRDLDSDLMLVMFVIGNEIVNRSNMEILCTYMPNALRHILDASYFTFSATTQNTLTHCKLMRWMQINFHDLFVKTLTFQWPKTTMNAKYGHFLLPCINIRYFSKFIVCILKTRSSRGGPYIFKLVQH